MSRFFGNKKYISDANIKRWIMDVKSSDGDRYANTNRTIATFSNNVGLDTDPVLEAAYVETKDFVDQFIRRNDLDHIADELKFFEDYDKQIKSDIEIEANGIPKLSSLPKPPSPPPIDYDQPDDHIVNTILEKMLEKPIFPREKQLAGQDIDETFYNILPNSANSKGSRASSSRLPSGRSPNFLARQKIRQELVKQNREKKELEERAKRQEETAKREMIAEVKKKAAAEQKERELKEKAEEEEIKREMMKIKQQMESQKKLIRQMEIEKQAVIQAAEAAARTEIEMEMEAKQEIEELVKEEIEKNRRLKLNRLGQLLRMRTAENVKLQQKCFKSWYSLVFENRMTVARFRAVSDWRTIVRVWNRWRFCVQNREAERAALKHADNIKNEFRKENMSENHYKRRLLSKCFKEWLLFVAHQNDIKYTEAAKNERKAKMESFLAAATAATFVVENSPAPDPVEVCNPVMSKAVDELFSSPSNGFKLNLDELSESEKKKSPGSTKVSSKRKSSGRSSKTAQCKPETFAEDVNSDSESDVDSRIKKSVSGNHRIIDKKSDRQQNIINLQRERIRDQKMLIKELSYARRQTEMMQQIGKYEELLKGLDQLTKVAPNLASKSNNNQKKIPSRKNSEAETQEAKNTQSQSDASTSRPEGIEAENDGETADNAQQVQMQLHEVVKLFHATKPTSSAQTTPAYSAQTTTRRAWSARPAESNFTKKMEERAEMRRQLKAEREKKKLEAEIKQIEEEKERQAELQKKEEEEKREKLEEFKRKRLLEKQKEEQRQLQLQREQELMAKAQDANVKRLLKHYGWLFWRRLVENRRKKWVFAVETHAVATQRRHLLAWFQYFKKDLTDRQIKADNFYDKLLIKRYCKCWLNYGNYMAILEQKADRHYRVVLMAQHFNKWDRYVDYSRRKEIRDEDAADAHNTKRICTVAFRAWRKIPLMIREEHRRQQRIDEMRRRVATILPDYDPTPPTVTFSPTPDMLETSVLLENNDRQGESAIADENL